MNFGSRRAGSVKRVRRRFSSPDHRSAPDCADEDVGAAVRFIASVASILIMSRHTRTVYMAVDGTIVGRTPALYRRSPGKRRVRGGPLYEGEDGISVTLISYAA